MKSAIYNLTPLKIGVIKISVEGEETNFYKFVLHHDI